MADITVTAQGGKVLFRGEALSGREWITRNVVTEHGSHQVDADAAVDLVHKAAGEGVEVRLAR